MQETPAELQDWINPHPDEIGADHIEFLHLLQNPTWLVIDGTDNTRSRVIVTLLHANEPSGLKAVHRLIKDRVTPATKLHVVVVSVNAALHPPLLSHRYLPEERDMNRCFVAEPATRQEQLAALIAKRIADAKPEAVIDTHNTSAHSDAFAVTDNERTNTLQLASIFTNRLVVIDQHLGTLIETAAPDLPIVTVEFGGFSDPMSDQLALESLETFVTRDQLFRVEPPPMTLLRHPYRLEIDDRVHIHYASSVQIDADLTMHNTIDQLNFRHVEAGTTLGWLGKTSLDGLHAVSAEGDNHVDKFLGEQDGFLATRVPMTIFMATTDAFVARKDCLLYFTPDEP